nr:G172 [uncultured bacterium]
MLIAILGLAILTFVFAVYSLVERRSLESINPMGASPAPDPRSSNDLR